RLWASHGAGRWLRAIIREATEEQLDLRAMSLVYTTLLSLVPLLAVSFSVLKSFGIHNQLQPFLSELFKPLGPQGGELTSRIIGFVENMNVGVLGSLGVAMLFYTVGSMLEKTEAAFNHIWHAKSSRGIARRFSDYLSVVLVGPVLVFSAIGIMASMAASQTAQSLLNRELFGGVYLLLGVVAPYALIVAAFTFIYLFLPNTRVAFRSALTGGACAGLAWKALGWGFAEFVAGSANYDAVYSSLAIAVLFMMWLYLSWLVILLGGRVAFLHQYPAYLAFERRRPTLGNRQKEWAGLAMMLLIAERFARGQRPWTLEALCQHLRLPVDAARELLRELVRHGLLFCMDNGEESYLPAKDLAAVSPRDVYQAIRGEAAASHGIQDAPVELASRLCGQAEAAGLEALEQRSLLQLIEPAAANRR
ncbi:YhjD/YihY/BrkB family envelope integrity protein, partial [Methylogaea oryzae]|uniref:YhjD/YihY/BrkB family envelope integrity protein n=1 Tax=Methylogaea oryzae TaxID=1295382 RepID=UPI0006D0370F